LFGSTRERDNRFDMESYPTPIGCLGLLALLAIFFACLLFPPLIIVFLILIGLWSRWDEWKAWQALAKLPAEREVANASSGSDE
jgi:ABC-type transport system involved in cytochrome bd biosynthesis fused ATPase/permease subunit